MRAGSVRSGGSTARSSWPSIASAASRSASPCNAYRRCARRCAESLTNLKKSYQSLLELSFPELGDLLELDGIGIRRLLAEAPTPEAIAQKRLATLEKNWMLRPKAARLKALAAHSMADPVLAQASAPALQLILQSLAKVEGQLRAVDKQIEAGVRQSLDPKAQALLESIPGFGPTLAAKVLAYLPREVLHSGPRRAAAARLQAFMGNDPRLRQSGQWQGQTKMSKRGVEPLRTAFFQAAFNAAQHDPQLKELLPAQTRPR
jgi:transposase